MCPVCGGKLEKKGWVTRIEKKAGGGRETLLIEIRKCTNESCRKCHRLLPDELLPYKHYDAELIEAVIDGVASEEDEALEEGPSPVTMKRWQEWWERLRAEAEGRIRSAAYRILDLSEQFLGSRESLLERIKERIVEGWLAATMKVMCNSG